MKTHACLLLLPFLATSSIACSQETGKFDVVALADSLEGKVEELRGLRFRKPVKKGVKNVAEMREILHQKIYESYSQEEMRISSRVGALLGLLPDGYDLEKGALDFLEVGVGGLYDPKKKTFYLAAGMPAAMLKTTIVHEMTHALDDQYFNLDQFYNPDLSEDQGLARAGVVEGSAMLVMNRYQLSSPGLLQELADPEVASFMAKQSQAIAKTPPYLLRSLLCGYIQGPVFLSQNEMNGAKQNERVSEAFANAPRSSEQLLHPEKYWDPAKRDEPMTVSLPDLGSVLGDGWKKVGGDTFGELTLAGLVQDPDDAPDYGNPMALAQMVWTNESAEGWGGDRWDAYEKDGEIVVCLLIVWDREEDSKEFVASYRPPIPETLVLSQKDRTLVIASKKRLPNSEILATRIFSESKIERVLQAQSFSPIK